MRCPWLDSQSLPTPPAVSDELNGRITSPPCPKKELKRASSRLIKRCQPALRDFVWQNGYGVFSLGFSQIGQAQRYIARQEEPHRKVGFQDELRTLLKRYQVDHDERYLWD
ncbi:MAG: transposase IS200-family protein [Pedosphaera sp.]|nr:transposase IS200-family protein [Pedosphaera sp.]